MADAATLNKINENLESLRREVIEIKMRMVDSDALLAEDERLLLKKAREERKWKQTISLAELEKELRT